MTNPLKKYYELWNMFGSNDFSCILYKQMSSIALISLFIVTIQGQLVTGFFSIALEYIVLGCRECCRLI